MPCHTDKESTVVTPIRWPPILRLCHQVGEVFLEGWDIKLLQLFVIIEISAKWIRLGVMLMENVEIESVRPPICI